VNPLQKKIIGLIKEKGPITFAQFMSMALYDPEFGYYNTAARKIGREGDFYTSAYLHPAFGSIIARQIEEMWTQMGRPADFRIIEMGAGAGYLCKDFLESVSNKDFFSSMRYTIIEQSPAMREHQQQILAAFSGKVEWASALSEFGSITGCIFSNELLDAFPVHKVRMEEALRELYVDFDDENGFFEREGVLSVNEIESYFAEFDLHIGRGYTTEVNLGIKRWMNEVNESLARGFVLTIDYGHPAWDYYSEDRDRGTLLCYHSHQVNEDPYTNIGEQDITAHVNFSALKKWGEDVGISTIGYTGQGAFLVSLGIDEDIKRIAESSDDYLFEIARIKKLIMPQGMGESHKVMIQQKGTGSVSLKGFSLRNQARNL
jgi:SAM-dependent MidA family methyltransferase